MSSLLPLDVRLRTLESQIYGVPASLVDAESSRSAYAQTQGASGGGKQGAARRLREVEEGLWRLGGESEGIKRLLDGYEQYLPLLTGSASSTAPAPAPATAGHTADSSTTTAGNKEDQPDSQRAISISESDLLPDSVKLTMILEAAADITAAERELREIELLKQKGVEGSGELESLLPLRPNLISAIQRSREGRKELNEVRGEVGSLLGRYNEYTSTVSDLFLELHHRLQQVEEGVSRIERRRRKEIAERY